MGHGELQKGAPVVSSTCRQREGCISWPHSEETLKYGGGLVVTMYESVEIQILEDPGPELIHSLR